LGKENICYLLFLSGKEGRGRVGLCIGADEGERRGKTFWLKKRGDEASIVESTGQKKKEKNKPSFIQGERKAEGRFVALIRRRLRVEEKKAENSIVTDARRLTRRILASRKRL